MSQTERHLTNAFQRVATVSGAIALMLERKRASKHLNAMAGTLEEAAAELRKASELIS